MVYTALHDDHALALPFWRSFNFNGLYSWKNDASLPRFFHLSQLTTGTNSSLIASKKGVLCADGCPRSTLVDLNDLTRLFTYAKGISHSFHWTIAPHGTSTANIMLLNSSSNSQHGVLSCLSRAAQGSCRQSEACYPWKQVSQLGIIAIKRQGGMNGLDFASSPMLRQETSEDDTNTLSDSHAVTMPCFVKGIRFARTSLSRLFPFKMAALFQMSPSDQPMSLFTDTQSPIYKPTTSSRPAIQPSLATNPFLIYHASWKTRSESAS